MSRDLISELAAAGVVKQAYLPKDFAWLDDGDKHVLVEMLIAGEGGLHKRVIRKLEKQFPDSFIKLEAANLIVWERDNNGRPMFLVLTWKGQEIAELLLAIARSEALRATARRREVPN